MRRPMPSQRSKTPFAARGEAPVPPAPNASPAAQPVSARARETAAAEAKAVHASKAAQDEFGFGEVESRGHFEKTDRNLFDGQDLDVPTYLRRGIKIMI
jgi:cell division protein FtsZ